MSTSSAKISTLLDQGALGHASGFKPGATDADASTLVPVCRRCLRCRERIVGEAARSCQTPLAFHDSDRCQSGLAASAYRRAQGGNRCAIVAAARHRRHAVSQAGRGRRPRYRRATRLRLSERRAIGRASAGLAWLDRRRLDADGAHAVSACCHWSALSSSIWLPNSRRRCASRSRDLPDLARLSATRSQSSKLTAKKTTPGR